MALHTLARRDDRPKLETMIRVIPADPRSPNEIFPVTLLDPPTYKELVEVVGPHLGTSGIERVRVFTYFLAEGFSRYLDMFVHENGAAKYLKRNPVATAIYQNNALTHQKPPPDPATLPSVYGTAVLFRDEVWS